MSHTLIFTYLSLIAYLLNLSIIIYLAFQLRGQIKTSGLSQRDASALAAILLISLLLGALAVQSSHYAVDSEGWEDTYIGKAISESDLSEFGHYRYGYTYPFTLAGLFLLWHEVSIISLFSLFCFLASMVLIFLSLYIMTESKPAAYLSLGIAATMAIALKYTFIFQGKEIFLFLILSSYLLSLSLLYRRYSFRALSTSFLLLLFAINLKYEMMNLVYLIPIAILLPGRKVRWDILRYRNLPILLASLFILFVTTEGFLIYSTADKVVGGYTHYLTSLGPASDRPANYIAGNVEAISRFLAANAIPLIPVAIIGLVLPFRRYMKQIALLITFGILSLIPYLIYFPYLIEERYLISFSIILIALGGLGLGSLYSRLRDRSRIAFSLILIALFSLTLYSSFQGLYPITTHDTYRQQDTRVARSILVSIPDTSSVILVTHLNTEYLLKIADQEELHDIMAIEQRYGTIVVNNLHHRFYFDNQRHVNSTYPLSLRIDKPTYFIQDFYCEQEEFELMPFLCDALLKRFDSEIISESDTFRLYMIEERGS